MLKTPCKQIQWEPASGEQSNISTWRARNISSNTQWKQSVTNTQCLWLHIFTYYFLSSRGKNTLFSLFFGSVLWQSRRQQVRKGDFRKSVCRSMKTDCKMWERSKAQQFWMILEKAVKFESEELDIDVKGGQKHLGCKRRLMVVKFPYTLY